MLRRALLFVVVFAAGLGLLFWLTGLESIAPFGKQDASSAAAERQPSPRGVSIASGKGAAKQRARVEVGGAGRISPLQGDFTLPSGKVVSPPEYELVWDNARPIGKGLYRLDNARMTVYERVRDASKARVWVVAKVRASSMELAAANQGGQLVFDREHAITLFDAFMTVFGEGGEGFDTTAVTGPDGKRGVASAKDAGIEVETQRMIVRAETGVLRLETADNELVTIRTRGALSDAVLTMKGRGLDATLHEEAARGSHLTLLSEIDVRGVGALSSALRLHATGDGPLRMRERGPELWTLELERKLVVRAVPKRSAPDEVVIARGDRLMAWLRSSPYAQAPRDSAKGAGATTASKTAQASERARGFSLSDLRVDGKRARFEVGANELRADRIEVAFDAFGQPSVAVAYGRPELDLVDESGKLVGTLHSDSRMRWVNGRSGLDPFFSSLGVDFGAALAGFDALPSYVPESHVSIAGPAVFVPADQESGFSKLRSTLGARADLATRAGTPRPRSAARLW